MKPIQPSEVRFFILEYDGFSMTMEARIQNTAMRHPKKDPYGDIETCVVESSGLGYGNRPTTAMDEAIHNAWNNLEKSTPKGFQIVKYKKKEGA